MKSNTPMNQGNTLDPESNALNPAGPHEKTWGSFAIFNIWANDVQSLFGYTLVASLFISYGVGGWTAFAGLIAAGLFVPLAELEVRGVQPALASRALA